MTGVWTRHANCEKVLHTVRMPHSTDSMRAWPNIIVSFKIYATLSKHIQILTFNIYPTFTKHEFLTVQRRNSPNNSKK